MCCYRSRLVIDAFKTFDISQDSVATHLRCGGIFSDSIITNIFFWFWQWNSFENRLIFDKVKAYKKLCHFWATMYVVCAVYTFSGGAVLSVRLNLTTGSEWPRRFRRCRGSYSAYSYHICFLQFAAYSVCLYVAVDITWANMIVYAAEGSSFYSCLYISPSIVDRFRSSHDSRYLLFTR